MKKRKYLIVIIIMLTMVIVGVTFAYFQWSSDNNSNVNFTVNGLGEYIEYSKGNDILEEEFYPSSSYTGGLYSSVNLYKSTAGTSKTLYGHFYLNTVGIAPEIISNPAFKWVLIDGDNSSSTIISQGDFSSASVGGNLVLAKNIELSATAKTYTLWIWIDDNILENSAIENKNLLSTLNVEVTEVTIS